MTVAQDGLGALDSESFTPPSFRLLIVGKNGVGKTSLINQAFGVDLPVSHIVPSEHNIEREITSPVNDMFILHDSPGLEDQDWSTYDTVQNFIEGRRTQPDVKNQLHAIWLCCALSDLTPLGIQDCKILTTYCNQLPVVIVFTKLDVLESQSREDVDKEHPGAEQGFKDGKVNQKIEDVLRTSFIEPIREVTGKEYFPHVKVSVFAPHGPSVQGVVKITQQLLTEKFGPLANNSAALGASVAQRVNPDVKIDSSIVMSLKAMHALLDNNSSLDDHLHSVHRKLTTIWNFDGGASVLSPKRLMPRLRSSFRDQEETNVPMDDASNIVIYVTDFIFILRLIFHETKTPQGIRALTPELADAVVDAYAKQQKEKVHEEVNNYLSELGDSVQNSPEAVAQFLRQFINKHRLRLSIGRPPLATPARLPEKHEDEGASPKRKDEQASSPSMRHAEHGTHKDGHTLSRYECFMAAATDDDDFLVGTVKLKLKRKIRSTRNIMVKIVKTHERYCEVVPELNKWAACLKFRLEVQGDTCPILKLTGRLQDDGCRQSDNQGVLEIKNVDPPPPGGLPNSIVQRESARALTVGITGGGNAHVPTPNLSYSVQSKKGWTETHEVTRTTFDNISPRKEFTMDFRHPPGVDSIPAQLFFTILIAYPSRPTPFTLDLLFTYGETGSCSVTCDGESEIKKFADPIQ